MHYPENRKIKQIQVGLLCGARGTGLEARLESTFSASPHFLSVPTPTQWQPLGCSGRHLKTNGPNESLGFLPALIIYRSVSL